MEVALEKTIDEFKFWPAMTRKMGSPTEQLLHQYTKIVEEFSLHSTQFKGDSVEVDSVAVWGKIVDRLFRKEYQYDVSQYGEPGELSEKIAYFFHSCLQGIELSPGVLKTLPALRSVGIRTGLIADGQSFSLTQLSHTVSETTEEIGLGDLLDSDSVTLSYRYGIRKPSVSLFVAAIKSAEKLGYSSKNILHVSHRLTDDLTVAKQLGIQTALYVGDGNSSTVTPTEVRDPENRPNRLITDLQQLRDIVGA